MIKVVASLETSFIEACISRSVYVSRADVASSKHIIAEFLSNALAIAHLCFSPPESFNPLSPTSSWYPYCNPITNECIYALFADGTIVSINLSVLVGSSIISLMKDGPSSPPYAIL